MRSTLSAHQLGELGESTARQWCLSHNLTILATNYCAPGTREEIDIIARSRLTGEIVFVEVKTRRSISFGWPEDSVTTKKQQAIQRTALQWLAQKRREDSAFGYPMLRFDVLSLVATPNGSFKITQFRDVFA